MDIGSKGRFRIFYPFKQKRLRIYCMATFNLGEDMP